MDTSQRKQTQKGQDEVKNRKGNFGPLQTFMDTMQEREDYILQQEINFFGKIIPKGTLFIRKGEDYWWPVIDGAHCPHYQVSFMITRNNPEYFLPPVVVKEPEEEK